MLRLGLSSLAVLSCLALTAACEQRAPGGTMGASGGAATGGSGGSAGTGAPLDCAQAPVPRAPLRRLTRFEYNNTVRDFLGVTSRPADSLPGEELGNGFGNDADVLGVSRLLIDGYRGVAAQLAKQVTADPATTVAFAGCDPAQLGEDACAQSFLGRFLARAFRRPAEPPELAVYTAAFARGRELGGDFASGIRLVVERALQTPQFLYRVELGEPVDAARLLARPGPYEMATRLSYLLWGSLPDQALFDAAAQGGLATKEGVLAQAQRMLGDPRAREVVGYFHGMLLGIRGLDHLERNAEFYPTYQPGLGALFRQETELFLDDVVWNGGGDLRSIFTAPYSFVNGPLAQYYGIAGVSGDAFQRVDVNPAQRQGLLTQASILALTTPGSRTDPVVRGKWVFSKLLCGVVGDPPPNVPKLPEPEPGLSVRDRLAMHRDDNACRGCHQLMDPIGFGFEHYDGAGLWRETDNGLPVDDSGEIVTHDVAGPFKGLLELGQKLGSSRDVRDCFVGHWLTYAYGRVETEQDVCTRSALEAALEQAQGNVKALLVALTQTDAFLYRPLVEAGK
jgi:hypothetical protein